MKKIIVDTNIVFSALRAGHPLIRQKLANENYIFYAPKFLFVEIFKHKERILKNSARSEEDTLEYLSLILHDIHFINENIISTHDYVAAYLACKEVDENDVPFVAMAFALDAKIWTRDEKIKMSLLNKGFDIFINENDI